MRAVALVVLLLLAGCAGGPQSLGITGPGNAPTAPAPAAATDNPLDNPQLMQSGGRYGPSYTPTTGGGNFWGYN